MLKKITILFSALIVSFSCITPKTPPPAKDYIIVGSSVPQFSVTGKDGTIFNSPQDFSGKTTLLVFFTSWCPTCQEQMPAINEAQIHFKDDDSVQIICIARGGEGVYLQSPEIISKYWQENSYSMPWYIDPDRSVFDMFASATIPRLYLIDSNNTVKRMAAAPEYSTQQVINFINS